MKLEGIEKKIECLKSGIPQYNAAFALRAWGELIQCLKALKELQQANGVNDAVFGDLWDRILRVEVPISRVAAGFKPFDFCNAKILPVEVSNISETGFPVQFRSVCYSFFYTETSATGYVIENRFAAYEWDKVNRWPWQYNNYYCKTKAETKARSLEMAHEKFNYFIKCGTPGGVPRSKFMEVSE